MESEGLLYSGFKQVYTDVNKKARKKRTKGPKELLKEQVIKA